MADDEFPLPKTFSKTSKTALLSVRCTDELKQRLESAIPNRTARASWMNELIEFGVRKVERKKNPAKAG